MISHAARVTRDSRNALRSIRYRGDARVCPICETGFAKLLPVPNGRDDALCPRCRSVERHRLLWLYLVRECQIENTNLSVLHVAPEPGTAKRLSGLANLHYVTTDIGGTTAMVRADLASLPFSDAEFDLVIVSHVLEHIPDDLAAMAEIRRVTAQKAVLQHPIDPARTTTYEDFSITDPADRERAFFQHDHVRIYGRDIEDRLRNAGFSVEVVDYNAHLSAEEREWFRTVQHPSARPERDLQGDAIYVCS